MTQASNIEKLTKKTPHVIGRNYEQRILHHCLTSPGKSHFLYFWADGGLGKTRLLQELQHMIKKEGSGYRSSGIIDLYHADLHSISEVTRRIVDGLDPEQIYYDEYRDARKEYEQKREEGLDPNTLEKRRIELNTLFVSGTNQIGSEANKLVICFDTVEHLQYESTLVEELAGNETIDTQLKGWIISTLPKLTNVLVVFTGRPSSKKRLIDDFYKSFGSKFSVKQLKHFNEVETREFINAIGVEAIPEELIPIVHILTKGTPILLHLIVDLIQVLSTEPGNVLDMFKQNIDLVNSKNYKTLRKVRQQIKVAILEGLLNEVGEIGGYLGQIALLPKGVNRQILVSTLACPPEDAELLITRLSNLSFIKTYYSFPDSLDFFSDRIFLHDEVYNLLTSEKVIPHVRLNERMIGQLVINKFYDQAIELIENRFRNAKNLDERIGFRNQFHQLLIERLNYILICNPIKGYQEYKRLSWQANRDRQVGFGMRLQNEFLRFYNNDIRRQQCQDEGISHEKVLCESIQMWVERFHWWGQYEKELAFTEKVFNKWDTLFIHPQDLSVIGNIYALWGRASTMKNGYNAGTMEMVRTVFEEMLTLEAREHEQLLAIGRLGTTLGYQCRFGGFFDKALQYNKRAISTFRLLSVDCPEELAIVLNNQAFITARLGDFTHARSLVYDAMRIAHKSGNEYSIGLNLTNLASIERFAREDFHQVIEYAQEALELFQKIQSIHGVVRARLNEGGGLRLLAEKDYEIGRNLDTARIRLDNARETLEGGILEAQTGGLPAEIPYLLAELGRVFRTQGILSNSRYGLERAMEYFRKAERYLLQSLNGNWSIADRADLFIDRAEVLFLMGDKFSAETLLTDAEELLGQEALLIPGVQGPSPRTLSWYFLPLCKVERLRSEISFNDGHFDQGLEHHTLAYIYHKLFSPVDPEKWIKLDLLYTQYLSKIPVLEMEQLILSLKHWVENKCQDLTKVNLLPFFDRLEGLIGLISISMINEK